MDHKFKKIGVIGTGTVGAQIAIIVAYHGYEVKTFDTDPQNFLKALDRIRSTVRQDGIISVLPPEEWEKGANLVKRCRDLRETVEEADLIIEAVPEKVELKRQTFAQIDSLAPEKTILATNSTSIPISKIESATKRPERCLNIHFYQLVRGFKMVELMGGTKTPPELLEKCRQWVKSLNCIPLMVKKELVGFGFPSVLRAIRRQAFHIWAGGYLDFQDIDRAWMIFTRMPYGPYGIIDFLGLDVAYDEAMTYYNESKDPRDLPPPALKEKIEKNELGVKTGKGFYNYPNPEYSRSDFLKG